MRTILKDGVFKEICPGCEVGGHCYASGGNPRRCPHREAGDDLIRHLAISKNDDHGARS